MQYLSFSKEFRRVFASSVSIRTGLLMVCACLSASASAEVGAELIHPSLPNYYPIIGGYPQKHGFIGLVATTRRVFIDESMNGQVVTASPGDVIEVRLKAGGGIPYGWVLAATSGTSVAPIGIPWIEVGPGLEVGRPFTRVVPFQTVRDGATTLRFELKSIVPSNPPAETFTVTIRVIPNRKPGKR